MTPLNPSPLQLEVIADRLTFSDLVERDEEAKQPVLVRSLLDRHRELGDRHAGDIVKDVLDQWPDCLTGLAAAASQLLAVEGGELRQASTLGLRKARSSFDEDLILAARVAALHPDASTETAIDLWLLAAGSWALSIPQDLQDVLELPLAETHLHLAGAVQAGTFWIPLMLSLLSVEHTAWMTARATAEEGRENRPTQEVHQLWMKRLAQAAVLRGAVSSAIMREMEWHPFHRVAGLGRGDGDHLPPDNASADEWLLAARRLFDRIGYQSPDGKAELHGCSIWVDPLGRHPYRDYLAQAVEGALGLKHPVDSCNLGETCLLASALFLARSAGNDGPKSERIKLRRHLLWYIRIKQSFVRLLVHTPGIHGLDRFRLRFNRKKAKGRFDRSPRIHKIWAFARVRYQTRLAVLRWVKASTRLPLAPLPPLSDPDLQQGYSSLGAAASRLERRLELRISPAKGPAHGLQIKAVAQGIREALEVLKEMASVPGSPLPQIQVGLVFHLLKNNKDTAEDYLQTLSIIHNWLEEHPAWRPLVVGVDAASSELEAPPSRFSSAFLWLRRRLAEGSAAERRVPIALGRTFHVGEDFRDLFTGVRQVAFSVDLLGLATRDRLGHALALGLDPTHWYARQGASRPRLGEHLLDLLWAAQLLRGELGEKAANSYATVEARLKGIGLFSKNIASEVLFGWFQDLREEGPPKTKALTEDALEQKLVGYLAGTDHPDTHIELWPDEPWMALVQDVQERTLRRLEREGISIESNPTSNLLIGGLRDLSEHPVFRFHPVLRTGGLGTPTVRVSISTDDPEVFRVSLREEYAALFEVAQQRFPFGRGELLDWLDRLRRDGFDSSFLNTSSPAGDELARYLGVLTLEGQSSSG